MAISRREIDRVISDKRGWCLPADRFNSVRLCYTTMKSKRIWMRYEEASIAKIGRMFEAAQKQALALIDPDRLEEPRYAYWLVRDLRPLVDDLTSGVARLCMSGFIGVT